MTSRSSQRESSSMRIPPRQYLPFTRNISVTSHHEFLLDGHISDAASDPAPALRERMNQTAEYRACCIARARLLPCQPFHQLVRPLHFIRHLMTSITIKWPVSNEEFFVYQQSG